MKTAAGIALFVAVAAAGAAVFIYSGVYNIGATSPHFGITVKVLRTAVEQSVKRQARNVKVPELDDPEKVHNGFKNFGEMCAICHGAPGKPASSDISKGLYPAAPDLTEAVKGWTPAELYVITKNGIRMSGMPAWGLTHSEEQLWEIVAFLKLLPTMPTEEYQAALKYSERNVGDKSKDIQAGHH
jgi:mono/diheme cytochrome c family protein